MKKFGLIKILILVFALISTSIPISYAAESYTVLIDEDFEDGTGLTWNVVGTGDSAGTIETADTETNAHHGLGNKYNIVKAETTMPTYFYTQFGQMSDSIMEGTNPDKHQTKEKGYTVVASFDIRPEIDTTTQVALLGCNAAGTIQPNALIGLNFDGTNVVLTQRGSIVLPRDDVDEKSLACISKEHFCRIRIEISVTNDNGDYIGTYDVYADGKSLYNDIGLYKDKKDERFVNGLLVGSYDKRSSTTALKAAAVDNIFVAAYDKDTKAAFDAAYPNQTAEADVELAKERIKTDPILCNVDFSDGVQGGKTYSKDKNTYWYDKFKSFGEGDKALSLNDDKLIKFKASYSAGENEDYCVTDFDIYYDRMNAGILNNQSVLSGVGKFAVYLTSDSLPAKYLARIYFDDGKVAFRTNGSDVDAFAQSIDYDKWHHFRVVMNRSDEGITISEVYVDGEEYTVNASVAKETFDGYNALCVCERTDVPTAYIDNVKAEIYETKPNQSQSEAEGELTYNKLYARSLLFKYADFFGIESYDNLKMAYESGTANEIKAAIENLFTDSDDYLITKVKFAKENDAECEKLTDAAKINGLTLNCSADAAESLSIIVAAFKDDVAKNVVVTNDLSIKSGSNQLVLNDFVIDKEVAYDEISIFAWSDLTGLVPLMSKTSLTDFYNEGERISVVIDGVQYYTDCSPYVLYDGRIAVPAENIINLLNASLVKIDGGYAIERAGEKKGELLYSDKTVYLVENECVICDIDSILRVLGGGSYTYNSETKTLSITSGAADDDPEWTAWTKYNKKITYPYIGYASFGFEYEDSADAEVQVFTRVDKDTKAVPMVVDGVPGAGWNMPLESTTAWQKADRVTYSDGKFKGYFLGLREGGKHYDVLVRVTKNGTTNYYYDSDDTAYNSNTVQLKTIHETQPVDIVKQSAETLLLKATYENISYYLDSAKGTATVEYKKTSESTFKKGYTPIYNSDTGQYSGSITGLEPDTEYTVKLTVGETVHTGSITTWDDTPTVTNLSLEDYLTEGGSLILDDIKGTANNWIRIDGGGQTVIADPNIWEAVSIRGCEYLILENLKIVGGKRYGVAVTGGSSNIRIINCDISDWGRGGVWDEETSTWRDSLSVINYDAGVYAVDCANVTVERCLLHQSRTKTNSWHNVPTGYTHPAGTAGIYYLVDSGFVARYNDFVGTDDFRFNDCIEGAYNSSYLGGIGTDSDIYGNMFYGANDDSVELDGAAMNVRFYKNRVEQTYSGISMAPIKVGPVYYFNNLTWNLGDDDGYFGDTLKQKDQAAHGKSQELVFNNTLIGSKRIAGRYTTVYNNISVADRKANNFNDSSVGDDELFTASDYNFKSGDSILWEHDQTGDPMFVAPEKGVFTLKNTSLAIGKAMHIDNFAEYPTQMGAFSDGDSFMPARPVALSANMYHIKLEKDGSAALTISTGVIDESLAYELICITDGKPLAISGTRSGALTSNTEYSFEITNKLTDRINQNGMLLFRLSNGYSLPVSFRLEG